jgi:hypothetical protein
MKWHLQIEPGTWVLWGYGKQRGVTHVDRDKIDLGHGMGELPFELPDPSPSLPDPQEYERRSGFGWRWNYKEGAGHSWRFAETLEEAVEAATRNLEGMRRDTREVFTEALRDVRVGGRKVRR